MSLKYKCCSCGEYFEKHSFTWKKKHRSNSKCKICRKEELKIYRKNNKVKIAARRKIKYESNKQKYKDYAWKMLIRKRYGVTEEAYDKMLKDQNYKCKICNSFDNRRLSIDHCHQTGKVRGLLCKNCNHGIGKFKDNVELLQKTINYLLSHNKIVSIVTVNEEEK